MHSRLPPNETIAGKRVSGVLEARLKNVFRESGPPMDEMRFTDHRVGDLRILRLIRRWLKVGVLESGEVHTNTDVLDLRFEKVIKPRLDGEAYPVRYIDDCVVCFHHQWDERFQAVLNHRLHKFPLDREPTKTNLMAFGRSA